MFVSARGAARAPSAACVGPGLLPEQAQAGKQAHQWHTATACSLAQAPARAARTRAVLSPFTHARTRMHMPLLHTWQARTPCHMWVGVVWCQARPHRAEPGRAGPGAPGGRAGMGCRAAADS